MGLVKFACAVVTRALFILVSLAGVWRVTWVKKDPHYWFMLFLLVPLVIEMIVTLKRRLGEDYKWFSPPIFLFLISIIPSVWLLELHHQESKVSETECQKLDSLESLRNTFTVNETLELDYLKVLSTVCSHDWILALHQIILILLIIGKWLLPIGGGLTRDKLSQLLLIFIGTAADILEFTSETLSDVKEKSPQVIYIILGVWTWSMLQFPLHVAVVDSEGDSEAVQESSFVRRHSTDLWCIVEALFIQDGPFLVVRLIVMIYAQVFHQMLGFFTIKNFLTVILNLYRLVVICQDYRSAGGGGGCGDAVL